MPTAGKTQAPTLAPTPRPLGIVVSDERGDLIDTDTEEPTSGPRYVDATRVTINPAGEQLLLRFDLVGDPPADLDPLYTTVGYYFLIDVDDDQSPDYFIDLSSTDDWSANLFNVAESYNYGGSAFPGSGVTEGTVVLLRVEMTAIGNPAEFWVQASVQYEDFPNPQGDPFQSTTAEDRIPNGDSEWLRVYTVE